MAHDKIFAVCENKCFVEIMPIGSIYTQLPNQPTPFELYGFGEWENISSDYANDFFRVEGDEASEFNAGEQAEGLPNITGECSLVLNVPQFINHINGAFSTVSWMDTTYSGGGGGYVVNMNASRSSAIYGNSTHVTPKNQTIRIWKRAA